MSDGCKDKNNFANNYHFCELFYGLIANIWQTGKPANRHIIWFFNFSIIQKWGRFAKKYTQKFLVSEIFHIFASNNVKGGLRNEE